MIKIRTLRKEDEKQLSVLAIKFLKNYLRGKIISKRLQLLIAYKNYEKYLRKDIKKYIKFKSKKEIIFVAEDGQKLVGYIYGRTERRPKMVFDKCGIVEDWFVEKKYREKGIGKMLLGKLVKWFKNKKCNCLEVNTYPTNNSAIYIYHKLGFIDKTLVMIKKI